MTKSAEMFQVAITVTRDEAVLYGRRRCTLWILGAEVASLSLPCEWSNAQVARYLCADFAYRAGMGLIRDESASR